MNANVRAAAFVLFGLLGCIEAFYKKGAVKCSWSAFQPPSPSATSHLSQVPGPPSILPSQGPEAAMPIFPLSPFIQLPLELLPEILSFCTIQALLYCRQVCQAWKSIVIYSVDYIDYLCKMDVEDKEIFRSLFMALKHWPRPGLRVVLQRLHDQRLAPPVVIMDLIVRLFMLFDVFSIVSELLKDTSIPLSAEFQKKCGEARVKDVLAEYKRAMAELKLPSRLVKVVADDLTPENWRYFLPLTDIFCQLMTVLITKNLDLALKIYMQMDKAVRLDSDFPFLSNIAAILPLLYSLPRLYEGVTTLFPVPFFYTQLSRLNSSSEDIMSHQNAAKLFCILSLVDINYNSLELLIPHLGPPFLKCWDVRKSDIGQPLIEAFLDLLKEFKDLNNDIDYGEVIISEDPETILRALICLAKINAAPFFVYRPLIVKFIVCHNSLNNLDPRLKLLSDIQYPPSFIEDLCVLALKWPEEVYSFLRFIGQMQRARLALYRKGLADRLISCFLEHNLGGCVLSDLRITP